MFLKGKRNRRGKKTQIFKMYSVEQQADDNFKGGMGMTTHCKTSTGKVEASGV